MRIHSLITAVALTAVASFALPSHAYADHDRNTGGKQLGGLLLGGALGGWAGSNIGKGSGRLAATALGALLGAGIGSNFGASLDQTDRAYIDQSTHNALEYNPSGQTSNWQNSDSNTSGTIVPTRTFQSNGRYCREFQQAVTVGGHSQQAYGTACRNPDGTWQIVSTGQTSAPVYQAPAPVYQAPVYRNYGPSVTFSTAPRYRYRTVKRCRKFFWKGRRLNGYWRRGHWRKTCKRVRVQY